MEAHLSAHLHAHRQATGTTPRMLDEATEPGAFDDARPDLVYPLGGGRYAHVCHIDGEPRYLIVEPNLAPGDEERVARLKADVAREAARMGDQPREGTLEEALGGILARLTGRSDARTDPASYHVLRDLARYGPVDALLDDPNLEDVHVVGTTEVHVIHRALGMLRTNVRFSDPYDLSRFLRVLSERIGRPVSDAVPIVDAVLPNGSRLNLVFSEDVSRRGPSLSLRRANDEPVSITRLVDWNTLSPMAAAYLWLCLENGMSLFLCGEAACGKTTTLNALLTFIDHRAKVYSAEDTPEVSPPHEVWQRLLTRETGPEAAHVRMFDLLKAALRSRPDYIVVGEIRGAEGAVAFQAMQTGHPTVATFHATDPTSLVQRLGAAPIKVPMTFMDNLNVVVFQETLRHRGRPLRRVTRVVEIAGSSADGIVAIPVFEYDPAADELRFTGRNNSHVLEEKIATVLGMDDTRAIYKELERRADALAAWRAAGRFESRDVDAAVHAFVRERHA